MWTGQIFHGVFLLAALIGLGFAHPITGELWGIEAGIWFWLSIAVPVFHQIYVWLCWRLELYHKAITRRLGRRGFRLYVAGFFILFIGRFLSLWVLAAANRGTIAISEPISASLAGLFALLAAYTMFSVARYFGFARASGADHFFDEYRAMPFVRRGMFRYSSNAMYTYAFLGMYVFGLVYQSGAALLSALFAHGYIWVHYLCTEKPDMAVIYGKSRTGSP